MPTTPNPADLYAGSKLRLQRQFRQLTQTDLANALGITFQQIQKYERGINRISASRLQTICQVLGVPVSFFFKDGDNLSNVAGGEQENASLSPYLASKEGLALNTSFIAIKNVEHRRAVLNLVKALAEMEESSASETSEDA